MVICRASIWSYLRESSNTRLCSVSRDGISSLPGPLETALVILEASEATHAHMITTNVLGSLNGWKVQVRRYILDNLQRQTPAFMQGGQLYVPCYH
jgi:hypothetical protein